MRLFPLTLTLLVLGGICARAGSASAARSGWAPSRVDTVDAGKDTQAERARLKEGMEALAASRLSGEREWQRRKSARVAIFSSMFVPGLGQTYNGRRLKTAIMVGLISFYATRAITENRLKVARRRVRDTFAVGSLAWKEEDLFVQFHRETSLDFVWFSGAAWLIGMLDAFVDAHLFDVRSVDPAIIHGSNNKYVGFDVKF
ncbi:MAG: DUF5683 domain-containing protein [Candidatus Krumholzibacteriia bacterium]